MACNNNTEEQLKPQASSYVFCLFFLRLPQSSLAFSCSSFILLNAKAFYHLPKGFILGFPLMWEGGFLLPFVLLSLLSLGLRAYRRPSCLRYCTVSSFLAASSCSRGQRRKQELPLPFWAAGLMPMPFVLNTRVQFLESRAAPARQRRSLERVLSGTVPALPRAWATECNGLRKKDTGTHSVYSKSSLFLSVC